MATGRRSTEKESPLDCRQCKHWGEVSEKVRVHELLERTIEKFEAKIKKQEYEPTVAEYMKLLQFDREIGRDDEPQEIRVTWVDPKASADSGE